MATLQVGWGPCRPHPLPGRSLACFLTSACPQDRFNINSQLEHLQASAPDLLQPGFPASSCTAWAAHLSCSAARRPSMWAQGTQI